MTYFIISPWDLTRKVSIMLKYLPRDLSSILARVFSANHRRNRGQIKVNQVIWRFLWKFGTSIPYVVKNTSILKRKWSKVKCAGAVKRAKSLWFGKNYSNLARDFELSEKVGNLQRPWGEKNVVWKKISILKRKWSEVCWCSQASKINSPGENRVSTSLTFAISWPPQGSRAASTALGDTKEGS